MVWSFPSTRTNLTFLDSQSLNYIGEGDILRSNNNLWWITFNKDGILRTNNNYALNRVSNIPFDPRVLSISKLGSIESHNTDGEPRGTQLSRKAATDVPGQFILQIEDDGKINLLNSVEGSSTLVFDISTVGRAGPPSGWDPAAPWPPVATQTSSSPQPTPNPNFNSKALWSDTNPVMQKGQFIVSPSGNFRFGVGEDGYVQIVKDSVVLRRFSSVIIDSSTASTKSFSLTLDATCTLVHSSAGKVVGSIFEPVASTSPKQLTISDDGVVVCSDKVSGERLHETGYKIFKLQTSTPLNYMNTGEAIHSDSSITSLRLERRSLVLTCNGRTRRVLSLPEDASRLVLESDGSVNVYSRYGNPIWSPIIETDGSNNHILEALDDCQAVSSRSDKSVTHVVLADGNMPAGLSYTKIFQIVKGSCIALKYGNVVGSRLTTELCRENALQRWAFDAEGKLHPESNPEL
ncbi:hypothetical protein HDU67_004020, partial [Dinochytrium kinnereticum]